MPSSGSKRSESAGLAFLVVAVAAAPACSGVFSIRPFRRKNFKCTQTGKNPLFLLVVAEHLVVFGCCCLADGDL